LIGDLIRIFQSVGAMEFAESFYTVMSVGNIRKKACSSQEVFDWFWLDVFGRPRGDVVELPFFPYHRFGLQAL